jgi:hypothetical protein
MSLNLTNDDSALPRSLAGLCMINRFHHFPPAKKSGYCFPEKKSISPGLTFDLPVHIHPPPSWRDKQPRLHLARAKADYYVNIKTNLPVSRRSLCHAFARRSILLLTHHSLNLG